MRYETKVCQFCKNKTRHRIEKDTGEELCLRCNNQPPKPKDYKFRGFR